MPELVTGRRIISALTIAGTALMIATPTLAQTDMPICRDNWDAVFLEAFRRLNPHEEEAAFAMVKAFAERAPVPPAALPASPDAELLDMAAVFAGSSPAL